MKQDYQIVCCFSTFGMDEFTKNAHVRKHTIEYQIHFLAVVTYVAPLGLRKCEPCNDCDEPIICVYF
jgi:hypothetical protein